MFNRMASAPNFHSNRFWQALSLLLGLLFVWERYDLGQKLDHAWSSGHRHRDVVLLPEPVATTRCDCPPETVKNSTDAELDAGEPLYLPAQGVETEEGFGRSLSGDTNSSGTDHTTEEAHAVHPHVALFYLLSAVFLGTIVLHLMTLPMFHGLQQTVVLFFLGLIHSLIFSQLNIHDTNFGPSYDMWMNIDPHLLLYSMLPALLTGDAITIDTSIARKVAYQCIYLAGPGVLAGSFGIAGFCHFYFSDWPFLLCLVTGSILSATDPVAVVGLLKELGASPTLTVQIQGESLLNDGTAIVLFLLAYRALEGEEYDTGEIIIFLVKMALSAVLLGGAIGYLFFIWIRSACKRLEHHAGLIQTTLTICCAYSSFCIAEGLLEISGVLSTVSAALVLADKMWPSIVEKEGLHQVWHMLEYLGNTLIFFLAGGLTGKAATKLHYRDVLDLAILYLVATVCRGLILFISRPILSYLSETKTPISWQDALIMTWGGLRGAVGLALAVQVNVGRISNNIDERQADQVLFFVAGMACLTLAVNATTSPVLVRSLGVTRTPQAKQQMLLSICEQMRRMDAKKENPKVVHQAIAELMTEASASVGKMIKKVKRSSSKLPTSMQAIGGKATSSLKALRKVRPVIPSIHVNELVDARVKYASIQKSKMRLLQAPKLAGVGYDDMICGVAQKEEVEDVMVQVMNEALLKLVRSHYWHLIDNGEFVDGSTDSELLLHSVRLGIDGSSDSMCDLKFLKQQLHLVHEQAEVIRTNSGHLVQPTTPPDGDGTRQSAATSETRGSIAETDPWSKSEQGGSTFGGYARSTSIGRVLLVDVNEGRTPLMKFTDSVYFNFFMGTMITLNVVYIIVDQVNTNDDGSSKISRDLTWGLELFFVTVFTLEFLLKFVAYRCSYFAEAWNMFDFALVVVGLVGLVILGYLQGKTDTGSDNSQNLSPEARLFRINKVFRVLRIIRIFRLLNFARVLYAKLMKKEFSLRLAEQLQAITVLKAFIKAHMHAQDKLLTYFGNNGKPASTEVAITLVQSQAQTYRALYLAGRELEYIDPAIIKNVNIQRKVFKQAHDLSEFVMQALHDGVITARMAETVLHPVRDHMRVIDRMLSEVQAGMRGRSDGEASEGTEKRAVSSSLPDDGFYDSEQEEEPVIVYEDDSGMDNADDVNSGAQETLPTISSEVPCMPVRLGAVRKDKEGELQGPQI